MIPDGGEFVRNLTMLRTAGPRPGRPERARTLLDPSGIGRISLVRVKLAMACRLKKMKELLSMSFQCPSFQ